MSASRNNHLWRLYGEDALDYGKFDEVYSWVNKKVRAGVICLRRDGKLLVIKNIDKITIDSKFRVNNVRGLYGFPKGMRESEDKNVLDTAFRELGEETGIKRTDGEIKYPPLFIERNGEDPEVFVYLIMVLDSNPAICIANNEISSYEWLSINELYLRVLPESSESFESFESFRCSKPTKKLILMLKIFEKYIKGLCV